MQGLIMSALKKTGSPEGKELERGWVSSLTVGTGIGYLCIIVTCSALLLYVLGYLGDLIVLSLLLACPIVHYLILKAQHQKKNM